MSPVATRLRLNPEAPTGLPALRSGLGWIVIAAIAMTGVMLVVTAGSWPVVLRIIVGVTLTLVSTVALMLASDSIARWLHGRFDRWDGRLQWFTTSVVALAVVVAAGAPISSFAPDTPGVSSLAVDFDIDLLLGLISGLTAIGLILGVAAGFGALLFRAHRRLGLEARGKKHWGPPTREERQRLRQLLRGLALGSAGLVASAVCTAVVSTITSNPTGPVDQPVHRETSFLLNAALPIFFWFVGTGIVWLLFVRRHGNELRPHPRLRHGTHGSALAICLMIFAAWVTAASVEHRARQALWSDPGGVPSINVSGQKASLQSPYLAQQFEPRLWLASGENWDPTEVTWYVKQNKVSTVDPPFCNSHPAGRPPPGCYQIRGQPPGSCDSSDPGPCAHSGDDDPALYYRYEDLTNRIRQRHSRSAAGARWVLIQYWVFYNYDSLRTWLINQWHQSDWEQVSVVIRRRGSSVRPVEVAFSEHCYGAHLPPDRVRWAGTHPIVYVARGSHANYPRPVSVPVRQLRCSLGLTPRYLGVAGLFFSPAVDGSRIEIPLAYLIGLHDTADGHRRAPPLKLVSIEATPAITSFTGRWGLDNNLSPWGLLRLRSSAGPAAPQTQAAWTRPVSSMACNHTWLTPQDPAFCLR